MGCQASNSCGGGGAVDPVEIPFGDPQTLLPEVAGAAADVGWQEGGDTVTPPPSPHRHTHSINAHTDSVEITSGLVLKVPPAATATPR